MQVPDGDAMAAMPASEDLLYVATCVGRAVFLVCAVSTESALSQRCLPFGLGITSLDLQPQTPLKLSRTAWVLCRISARAARCKKLGLLPAAKASLRSPAAFNQDRERHCGAACAALGGSLHRVSAIARAFCATASGNRGLDFLLELEYDELHEPSLFGSWQRFGGGTQSAASAQEIKVLRCQILRMTGPLSRTAETGIQQCASHERDKPRDTPQFLKRSAKVNK